MNQIEVHRSKGIDAIALGNPAGDGLRSKNSRKVFQSTSDVLTLAFCTPEYLFGIESTPTFTGTSGDFHLLLDRKDIIKMVTTDEAHKIFDWLPDYRREFDDRKWLKELGCPIVAMSATLTEKEIRCLKQLYLRSPLNCTTKSTQLHSFDCWCESKQLGDMHTPL